MLPPQVPGARDVARIHMIVAVDVGTVPASGSVTIVFFVDISNPVAAGVGEIRNQGSVSSNELPVLVTDDPSQAGNSDPTVTVIDAEAVLRATKIATLLIAYRTIAAQQRPELKIDSAPEPSLLRAMQLNLRIREPIVERHDDASAQDTDATAEEALAVLNEEEAIRNGGVLSRREVGRDIWIHAHDAPGDEFWKRKRIFTTDLGIDKTPVELGHGGDSPTGAQLQKARQGCDRWDRFADPPVPKPRYPFGRVGE